MGRSELVVGETYVHGQGGLVEFVGLVSRGSNWVRVWWVDDRGMGVVRVDVRLLTPVPSRFARDGVMGG